MENQVKVFIERDHKQNQIKTEMMQQSHLKEVTELKMKLESANVSLIKTRQEN